jgi:predicted nucleotide-binding protein
MKIFLSWSGERSRLTAEALRRWLPQVLQAAEPWTSSIDLAAGSDWVRQIQYELYDTRAGIVCLTPENLEAPWLHVETGTLWARGSVVIPYLVDFDSAELNGPLARFQAVQAGRDGTWRMVQTLNRLLDENFVREEVLERAFELAWPILKAEIDAILRPRASRARPAKTRTKERKIRSDRELLEEIVRKVSSPPQRTVAEPTHSASSGFVFIVHGHDHGIKETVARFVELLGLKPVVLHEQPNRGWTTIEKFEAVTKTVAYAIVLLTEDDRGGTKDQPYKKQHPRARQNVVLELGFFMARLGRNKVAAVHQANVEIPSDYSGVLYLPFDEGGAWRLLLARELKSAGLEVDLNRVG